MTFPEFQTINRSYNTVFKAGRLSIGLVVPLETYTSSAIPTMENHLKRIQLAEKLGYAAVWLRDVPFNVPSFGDAGQVFDPFVYLGLLAGATNTIGLGAASIILPLRHPAQIAKAAASVDELSQGRLLLGIASGDRPEEYPAMNMPFEGRGDRFRDNFDYIHQMAEDYPEFANAYGSLNGQIDMLPKPFSGKLPLLITGSSRQSPDWLAQNGDGWMTFPRNIDVQSKILKDWRTNSVNLGSTIKPAMQPLYFDLDSNLDANPEPIHLGFRSGINYLRSYLKHLEDIGMNHVALNLRFNQANIESTLDYLAENLLPDFTH